MPAWLKVASKELKGLIVANRCFKKEDPLPGEQVVPLWLALKAKIGMHGLSEKLKARAVFRGDLCKHFGDIDPWNPHASWVSLKVFLGLCAYYEMHPCQIDFIMAYV